MIKIRSRAEFLGITAICLLLLSLVVLDASSPFRFLLGILLVLFLPGYALVSAFFPRAGRISRLERVGMSMGMSIVLSFLVGMGFNYTWIGLSTVPVAIAMVVITVALAFVGWRRRERLDPEEREAISLPLPALRSRKAWTSLVLALSIVIALSATGYVLAVPANGERFTELYLLPSSGSQASVGSKTVIAGETNNVVLGVVNHEQAPMSYRINTLIGGRKQSEIDLGPLAPEQGWQQEVPFVVPEAGANQKVEFLLDKGDGTSESVFLWVDATANSDRYTEFYVVFLTSNPWENHLTGYEYKATLGIVNREGRPATYRVEMWITGQSGQTKAAGLDSLTLSPGQDWEGSLTYRLEHVSVAQWAVFYLFKDGQDTPYRSILLPIAGII